MRLIKGFLTVGMVTAFLFAGTASMAGGQDYSGQEDPNKKVLKQGLLGAATGAIAAEASGGKAGTGALVGAGTNVIGGALLDTVTSSPRPQGQPVYAQQPSQQPYQGAPSQAAYPVQTQGYRTDPVYVQQPVYYPPQEDPTKKILKQGLLGAGTGAIAASASGGKAGKGALIGAGTNVIGSALLDALSGPSQPQPQPVYYQQAPPQGYSSQQPKKKILRRYDSDGNVVSEEEVWE